MATNLSFPNSSLGTSSKETEKSVSLAGTALAVFVGLVWGAAMLVVFGLWMRAKYDAGGRIATNIFLAAGAAAAALAIWQAFTLWLKKETPEQKTATLAQQRRLFGYLFLAAGIGLIALAAYVGVAKKIGGSYGFVLDNFAESAGVLLFGLMVLCAGYTLQQPPDAKIFTMEFLVDKVPLLKLGQLLLSVAAVGLFLFIFIRNRADNGFLIYLPELALLVALSLLAVTCFLWLNSSAMDEFGVRLFVLIFGGATGISLFLWALWRTIVWRQDIFLGGSAAWQGENAWRFWLCAYVLFLSLVLMFLSFNLARADIRTNVVLRRVMYGYDAVVQGFLLVGILITLNVVVYALVPFTFDWTKNRGAYALSDSSKNLISSLKKETHVFVLMSNRSPAYKDVHFLLDNCQALNSRLHVEYVSPDLEEMRYENLVKMFPKILPELIGGGTGRGVLVVYGALPQKEDHNTPHAFVSERKIYEQPQMRPGGEKARATFKGEGEILKELKFLVQDQKKRKVYVLQGQDEADPNNETGAERIDVRKDFSTVGISLLVERLKSDNYEVSGLSFGLEIPGQKAPANIVYVKESEKSKRKDIPDDCQTLIIAGASKSFSSEVLDSIERYMEKGKGSLLVFLDVFVDSEFTKLKETGLESFLKRYGVEVPDEFALRFTPVPFDDVRVLFTTTPRESENPLAQQFVGRTILMKRSARIVRPAQGPGRYKAETVLQMDMKQGTPDNKIPLVLKNVAVLADAQRFVHDLNEERGPKLLAAISKEPVPMAVAVTENGKPRMVVFGDTDFITNLEIARARKGLANYDFTVSAIEWMAEREDIGARPKESPVFILDPSVPYWRMVLLPAWLMLLGFLSLGVTVWIVRRR